jgi:hypothetical protein
LQVPIPPGYHPLPVVPGGVGFGVLHQAGLRINTM